MSKPIVTLTTKDGITRDFEFEHAVRLLNYKDTSWFLPKKSKFKLQHGNLIARPNK